MKTVRWCLRISCVIQFVSLIVFIVLSISSDTQYHECIDRRGRFPYREMVPCKSQITMLYLWSNPVHCFLEMIRYQCESCSRFDFLENMYFCSNCKRLLCSAISCVTCECDYHYCPYCFDTLTLSELKQSEYRWDCCFTVND